MIAIGERINGQFDDARKAIAAKDKKVIHDLARRQTEAGAHYLDVNVGTAAADQQAAMQWLVTTIQETCRTPLCLDSQKPAVIKAGLAVADTSMGIMLNSSPLDKKSDPNVLDTYIGMAKESNGVLITLTMDKEGVPQNVEKRVEIAAFIVGKAMELDFPVDKLYIDPIVLPVNVPGAQTQPGFLLEAIRQIKILNDPAPMTTLGLSNVSQGTTERSLINRIFLSMALSAGLDSAIVDVFDDKLMDVVATTEMLLNKQIYSDSFLRAYRALHTG
ncbi:MAG TPA: dihydropteroate synthase [Planctomycetota bacterium]|nr:dihydropteroate synthase [Planctomycetota bacterium]